MQALSDISGIAVALHINDVQSLVVMLHADGSVNRLGYGRMNESNRDLFIGVSTDAMFRALHSQVPASWMPLLNQGFTCPTGRSEDILGAPCKLTITFFFSSGSKRLEFEYGSESGGLPADVRDFVTESVRLTNPWLQAQSQQAQAAAPRRPWWRFW